MDNNNWRPTQAGDPTMDSGDWRSQLPHSSRERIVNKIMETLKRHLPVGQDGLLELRKIAVRFEEKVYADATNQSEYLRQISLKMLKMESKSQNSTGNSLAANSFGASNKPPESTSHGIQSQILSQGQPLSIPLSANQSQQRQQLLSQNIQNSIASQSSASLSPAQPSVSGLTQNSIPNAVGQGTSMQNISGASQISLGNSAGQGVPSNVFANSQRQLQGRQQAPQTQQPQQQAQNQQQYIYQQQLQQQILNQKFHQGNVPPSMMPSHIQQQQQQQQSHQNLLQPSQLQSSQQAGIQTSSVMQSSVMQPPVQQPNQVMLQQTGQSVLRQQQQAQQSAVLHQQQTTMQPQSILAPQQQQPLTGQQSSAGNMQQNQLIGQQTAVGDIQHQQQQRLLGQQNNIPNLQQQQQQQLMAQQNNLSSMHQQQLGPQSNVSGLQQQLLSGNSGMQTNQPNVHMLQQNKVPVQQQAQQNTSNILHPQGQQPQVQQPQQQLLSQSAQLQQSLGLQQPNQLSREVQQRFQASGQVSGSLLQSQNVIDQQKQLYQPHRALPDTSSTSLDSTAQTGHANGGDWQEEVYQKIKGLKEMYFHELNEMNQKITFKLQQHDFSQQPKSEQLERLKMFKTMLERLLAFLQCPKSSIGPGIKEKLSLYEKQIVNILTTNRPRKPPPSLQQGQLSAVHMHPMQQPQSQIMQVQSHENQMNSQMHSTNMQSNVASLQQSGISNLQQNGISNLQHSSVSSLSGVPNTQQNVMGSLHPASALDAGQGNALTSIQQVGSMQQNPVNTPQTANINSLSSQTGVTMMQSNINSFQSNSNMVQHQHLKQQQEQQMLQTHQLKQQMQQRQMLKQQILQQQQHQQQQQQQLHQQGKQQLSSQLQTQQMTQPHQINDVNELKMRQGMSVKPGVFQQNLSSSQRSSFPHQQLKPGPSFPISSPQLLQAASPQIMQHSSPQVDQQNLLASLTKAGTPLQSASSPFVVTSPSTPVAPSPIPGDSDKPITGLSSLSNSGNIVHQQTSGIVAPAPSLAIGTPGMSASPLLAEFSGPDGMNGNTLATVSGKPSVSELPLERLIRVIKSMSPSALSASVGDISSVISMSDRIAGSTPGNGSRAAVGEDLVAMTKCRLQARNFAPLDNMSGTRKIKRYTSAMPLNVVSSTGIINESFNQLTASEMSDLESTATSNVKRHRFETNHVVLEEIKEINQRLIDTVVDVNEEDVDSSVAAAAAEGGEGTLVKCSFTAVALGPNLKSQYASAQMSPIQPLRLLVPSNYPHCSPVLLDKCLEDVNSKGYEDLSAKVKSRFSISLRSLSQPMSLGDIAKTWDVCVRAVISDYAQQSGGGSFSTKYGSWENCLPAI